MLFTDGLNVKNNKSFFFVFKLLEESGVLLA